MSFMAITRRTTYSNSKYLEYQTHYLAPLQVAPSLQPRAVATATAAKSTQHHSRSFSSQKRSPPSSPDNRLNKKPRTFRDPNSPLPCCAVCLGRNTHRVIDCSATLTWDGKHDTIAERIHKALWTKTGKQLCTAWQREEGCNSNRHDDRHICSGCAAVTHGAQNCPRAQKA